MTFEYVRKYIRDYTDKEGWYFIKMRKSIQLRMKE